MSNRTHIYSTLLLALLLFLPQYAGAQDTDPADGESDNGDATDGEDGQIDLTDDADSTDDAGALIASGSDVRQLLVVGPHGAYGRFEETTVEQNEEAFLVGAAVRYYPDARTRADLSLDFGRRQRTFIPVGIGVPGQNPPIIDDETVVDTSLSYGLNVTRGLAVGIWTMVGWRHAFYDNPGFDEHVTGPLARVQFEIPMADFMAFHAEADYTFNLLSIAEAQSEPGDTLIGDVLGSVRFGGGFRYYPTRSVELGLAYQGQLDSFEFSNLLVHLVLIEAGWSVRF